MRTAKFNCSNCNEVLIEYAVDKNGIMQIKKNFADGKLINDGYIVAVRCVKCEAVNGLPGKAEEK